MASRWASVTRIGEMIMPSTYRWARRRSRSVSLATRPPVACTTSWRPDPATTASMARIIATYTGLPMSSTARATRSVRRDWSERAIALGT
jgi:hypothetical protein